MTAHWGEITQKGCIGVNREYSSICYEGDSVVPYLPDGIMPAGTAMLPEGIVPGTAVNNCTQLRAKFIDKNFLLPEKIDKETKPTTAQWIGSYIWGQWLVPDPVCGAVNITPTVLTPPVGEKPKTETPPAGENTKKDTPPPAGGAGANTPKTPTTDTSGSKQNDQKDQKKPNASEQQPQDATDNNNMLIYIVVGIIIVLIIIIGIAIVATSRKGSSAGGAGMYPAAYGMPPAGYAQYQ